MRRSKVKLKPQNKLFWGFIIEKNLNYFFSQYNSLDFKNIWHLCIIT